MWEMDWSEWWGVAGRRNLICFFLENRAAYFVLGAPLEGVASNV